MTQTFEIITYATHNQGIYDMLINNEYDSKVTTLGWGTTWDSFIDKFKGVYDHIKNKNDNHIIIFLDGFDTIIHKHPQKAIDIFKKNNYQLLFSKDVHQSVQYFDYIIHKMFPTTCKDNIIINSGLWMGYVKYAKHMLHYILSRCKKDCIDDQKIVNKFCHNFKYISIDTENDIFLNTTKHTIYNVQNISTPFISFPAASYYGKNLDSIKRLVRGVSEYKIQLFHEFFVIFLILTYIYLKIQKLFPYKFIKV